MKTFVGCSQFARTMSHIAKITGSSLNPMFNDVMLTADPDRDGGVLSAYATDMQISCEKRLSCRFEHSGDTWGKWGILVNAKYLIAVLKLFKKRDEICLYPTEVNGYKRLQIDVILPSGKISQHSLLTLPIEEYPPMPCFGKECIAENRKHIKRLEKLIKEPFVLEPPDKTLAQKDYDSNIDTLQALLITTKERLIEYENIDGQDGIVQSIKNDITDLQSRIDTPFDYEAICKDVEPGQRKSYDKTQNELLIQLDNLKKESAVDEKSKLQTVDFSMLATAWRMLLPSMCENDARKYLNGGYMGFTDTEQWVVATDSHTMAFTQVDIGYKGNLSIIVHKHVLQFLSATGESGIFQVKDKKWQDIQSVQFGVDRNRLVITTDDTTVISSLIDSEFPDFRAVIPKYVGYSMECDTKEILAALKRVCVCADSHTHRISIYFKSETPELHILSNDYEIGEAHEIVTVQISDPDSNLVKQIKQIADNLIVKDVEGNIVEGDDLLPDPRPEEFRDCMQIAYNATYLTDAIKRMGHTGRVRFEWVEPTAGLVCKVATTDLCGIIVMPMGT